MKTILTVMALLFSAPALSALKVLACEPEWAALTEELGGGHVSVTRATNGLQDPHHVQARPSLISKARRAQLLVCTGAELEAGWLPLLQHKTGNAAIQAGAPGYFMATDYVEMLGVPAVLDRSQGDVHAKGNPHIQTDPRNILKVATALRQRLQSLDPAHADDYEKRYQDFKQRWQQAMQGWNRQAQSLRGKHIVVHHNNWLYMNAWLGLQQVATLEPKPGIPPTTDHLAALLHKLKQQPADVILYAAYQSSRSAHWLSEKTGIPAVKLPFTVDGDDKAQTLFDVFDVTLERLQQAMQP